MDNLPNKPLVDRSTMRLTPEWEQFFIELLKLLIPPEPRKKK